MRTTPLAILILALAASAQAGPSWDVAPPNLSGATPPLVCPKGNGFVDPADALITLRRALNLVSGFSCFGQPIPDSIVDVAPPCLVDESSFPPIVVSGGNGVITPADALLILRASVGLIELRPPANLVLGFLSGTVPSFPSVGEVDRPPLGDFPSGDCGNGGDCDCDLDGELDPQEESFLLVTVTFDNPATEPYQVCALMGEHTGDFDFDAPPAGNFPGPEDHDGGGDGILSNPAPNPASYHACVTVCPEGFSDPAVECAEVEPAGPDPADGVRVWVGPLFPDVLTPDFHKDWSAVVDPEYKICDDTFDDNVPALPRPVFVQQCPDIAPDLVPAPSLGSDLSIAVIPGEPSQFDDIAFRVGATNQGNQRVTSAFDVDFYYDESLLPLAGAGDCLDTDQCYPLPIGDCFRTVAASPAQPLLEGDTVSVTCSDFGPDPLKLSPGLHTATVLVDGFGRDLVGSVRESDELNNVHRELLCVGASAEGFGRPDLAFAKVRFLERGGEVVACDRKEGDTVDIELTIANLNSPGARDLGLGRPLSPRSYDLLTVAIFPGGSQPPFCASGTPPCTDLEPLSFECVPVGLERSPLRGEFLYPLQDTDLTLQLEASHPAVPQDVDPVNNLVSVPLLNKPPTVDAGPPKLGVAGASVQLEATASDPNDVPAGSQPLSMSWEVLSQPPGSSASFDDPNTEDPRFTGSDAGNYLLRLSATDCPGATSRTDTVVVTLNPE